jgi:hypothetical protein
MGDRRAAGYRGLVRGLDDGELLLPSAGIEAGDVSIGGLQRVGA